MVDKLVNLIRATMPIGAPPRRVKNILKDLLVDELGELAALESAERFVPRVLARLQQERTHLLQRGEDPWFDFNSSSPEYIQGPCFAEPRDEESIKAAKARRYLAGQMVDTIRAINEDAFEILCSKLLLEIGARHAQKTRRTRDQGIDFFGELYLGDLAAPGFPFVRFQDHLRIWLVGQAKHYPTSKVSSTEVRELVGSVLLARHKAFASTTDLYQNLPLRSCDPVFALFLTTGTFSRDALTLGANSGVICKDVFEIAKLLLDRGIGLDAQGRPSTAAFARWLADPISATA